MLQQAGKKFNLYSYLEKLSFWIYTKKCENGTYMQTVLSERKKKRERERKRKTKFWIIRKWKVMVVFIQWNTIKWQYLKW
jgi:hypothetical protein